MDDNDNDGNGDIKVIPNRIDNLKTLHSYNEINLLNKTKLETLILFLNKLNIAVEVVNTTHTDFIPSRVYVIVDDNNMIKKVHLS